MASAKLGKLKMLKSGKWRSVHVESIWVNQLEFTEVSFLPSHRGWEPGPCPWVLAETNSTLFGQT